MKKFLFAIVCVLAFFLMTVNIMNYKSDARLLKNAEGDYKESYNDEKNMYLARKIAAMSETNRVAVVKTGNCVLIGIALKAGTSERNLLYASAKDTAEKYYPDSEIQIEIQTAETEEIFNLAACLEKGIPESVLYSRIRNLLKTD